MRSTHRALSRWNASQSLFGGIILNWNGSTWRGVEPNLVFSVDAYRGVLGSGPSDVWAVGDGGTIVHWDGLSWSLVPSGAGVNDTHKKSSVGQRAERRLGRWDHRRSLERRRLVHRRRGQHP
jgi:hypothetical protein